MIIFILGEDNYSSQKRLIELKNKFQEKYGDFNCSTLEFSTDDESLNKVFQEIEAVPFLGTKRMIIIKNFLTFANKELKEKLEQKLNHIPESSVVIFYQSGLPDKREKIFKTLAKLAKVEEYASKDEIKLENWVKKEVIFRGGKIENQAVNRLIQFCGSDLWRLSNEIDKLINYCRPKTIGIKEVEFLVREKVEAKIFDLVDELAWRQGQKAINTLHNLLTLGEKDYYLLAMIVYGFRNLIITKFLLDKNPRIENKQIVALAGLHPFVAQKVKQSAAYFSFFELKKIYQQIIKTELEIKSGKKESLLALDMLVADICNR